MNIWLPIATMLGTGIKAMHHPNSKKTGCDVLVTGRYFCDVVITGLPEMPRLGTEVWGTHCEIRPGASFIPAVALHRLGLRVAWPSNFGNDLFSRFVREQAQQEGLNEDWFQDFNTSALGITISFSFENERSFVSYEEKSLEPPYPDLIRNLQPAWVILCNLWKGDRFVKIVDAARISGTRIFLEGQGQITHLNDPEIRYALQHVDIFSPNLAEALRLTGTNHMEAALNKLAALCPVVVMKLGKDGAIAQQGSQVVRTPAISVKTVDTTGAGDNFDCGFIYGQCQGYSLEDSLRCGNICGGLSTEAVGGTIGAPSREILEEWRQSYYQKGLG